MVCPKIIKSKEIIGKCDTPDHTKKETANRSGLTKEV